MSFSNWYNFLSSLLFFALFFSCSKRNEIPETPEIKKLNELIDQKLNFRATKEKNLRLEKNKLYQKNLTPKQLYEANRSIANAYFGYQSDSALVYLQKNMELAKAEQNKQWHFETLIDKSSLLNSIGLFTESKMILDSMRISVPDNLRFAYNATSESLYTNLYEYSSSNEIFAEVYRKKLLEYYHKGFTSSKDSTFKYLFQYNIYRMGKEWKKAISSIDLFISAVPEKTRLKAIGFYCKADAEGQIGNIAEQKKYLALSAIEDIESATTENRSMGELAYVLYKEGNYKTAYRFMESAIVDANFYNARFRTFQISKIQPIIEKAYRLQINNTNTKLKISIVIISIMLILLGVVAYMIMRQLKIIARSRKELRAANNNLHILNHKLDEANRIKEEYVAYFINQCSIYLDKFDRYKKLISLRLSMGQVKKLSEMVNNKKNDEMDIDELYENFDKAFLRIYPNFVEEVNALLKPEERYDLKFGTLNTELRIYALIRLGIKDTAQISEFLRYSLRTIYNYRSKVKSKSVIENDDFEAKIMQIGSILPS